MARPPRRLAVALTVLLLSGCAARAPIDLGAWQAPVGREHPLTGRIWDVRAARFVSSDELVAKLPAARYVLLGERHDNPDHHRVQAALLRALVAAGRRPAVAFEQFTSDDAAAIARHLDAAPRDGAGLADAVNWKRSGWPDWAYYQPIAQTALDAGLPIVAANLPTAVARGLARGRSDVMPAGLASRYGLDLPLPGAAQAALSDEIREAHCGHIGTPQQVANMVLAQRARDAMLADRLLAGERDGAVLIAGSGHVRADRGVPIYLRTRVGGATIATVAPMEVRDAWTRPEEYAAAYDGRLPFDWVWFTPRMPDVDHCAAFRRPATTPAR